MATQSPGLINKNGNIITVAQSKQITKTCTNYDGSGKQSMLK